MNSEERARRRQVIEQDPDLLENLAYDREAGEFRQTKANAKNAAREKKKPAAAEDPEPKAEAADQDIADALVNLQRRFIAAEDFQLQLNAMWILHSHAIQAFTFTPYLQITSAEKGSGKSTVLDVLRPLVPNPLITDSISPAALARVIEQNHGTVLLDEYDILLDDKTNRDSAPLLRGILNGGFKATGSYTRVIGQGSNMQVKSFPTFGAKCLAGIGPLPDTIASRCVVIRLKRVPRGQCAPFRPDGMSKASKLLHQELEALRIRATKWAQRHLERIANVEPACPAQFTSRQADIAEPLLAVAEVLGGEWPALIRKALTTTFASRAAEDASIRVLLLGHVRKVFLDKYDKTEDDNLSPDKKQLRTKDLLEKLSAIEGAPWSEWNSKNITSYALAKLLRPLEIFSQDIRDPQVSKGYKLADFLDAFQRYLPPVCTCADCGCHEACSGSCSGSKSADSVNVYAGCSGYEAKKGGGGIQRAGGGELSMRRELENALTAAREVPLEDLPRLLGELEEIRATAVARLSRPPAPAADDGLLDVEKAAARLGVSTDYVYRHHAEWPFTRRVGKKLLFSRAGLERHLGTAKVS